MRCIICKMIHTLEFCMYLSAHVFSIDKYYDNICKDTYLIFVYDDNRTPPYIPIGIITYHHYYCFIYCHNIYHKCLHIYIVIYYCYCYFGRVLSSLP